MSKNVVSCAAGGHTATLPPGTVGCTAGSLAGAETAAIGLELYDPGGREVSARQSAGVFLFHHGSFYKHTPHNAPKNVE